MARPKNGAPRPDTVLVTFRLARSLVAELDRHAKQMPLAAPPTRSDAARDLIQRGLAGTALTGPSTAISDARVLATIHALGTGPGGTVALVDLRRSLASARRVDLDQAIFRLDVAGKVCLGKPVDLAAVTPADREAAINDRLRGMLIYVSSPVKNRNTVSV
jgi:hypothetical protein